MKKLICFSSFILASLLTISCSDSIEDWADPITNEQEESVVAIPGFTASAVSAIDLADAESTVEVFTANTSALPDGYSLTKCTIEMTPTGVDDATATTLKGDANTLSKSDLQSLIEEVYGKQPIARTFSSHVYATVDDGKGGVPVDCGTINIVITPEAPYISDHYYIVGEPSAWSVTETSLPFTHSDENKYDDPYFTVTFPVVDTDGDGAIWFAISDDTSMASGEWSDLLGCAEGNGNNGTSGTIKRRSEIGNDGSWKISTADAKYVRMTIDMMSYTYTIELLNFAEYIY